MTDPREFEDIYADNDLIKIAVSAYVQTLNMKEMLLILKVLAKRMDENGQVPTPMIDVNNVIAKMDIDSISKMQPGQSFTLGHELRMRKETVTDPKGDQWFPLFTDSSEMRGQINAPIVINAPIRQILEDGFKSERVKGVVINPFGKSVILPKNVLALLFGEKGPSGGAGPSKT